MRLSAGLPGEARRAAPRFEDERWRGSTLQLGLTSVARVVNRQTDIVMLGLLAGAQDAGVYRLAFSGSLIVAFSQEAVGALIAPRIATFHARGDKRRLQRMLTRSTRVVVALSLLVATTLIAFGQWLLVGLFGQEFEAGYLALVILTLSRLVQATAGPGTLVLNMTGHDREAARVLAGGSLLNIVLNGALIPVYGMAGAATATLLATLTWSYLVRWQARVRLGLDPSVWHRIGPADSDG
jgi:O-antigen/teichoic acid export membrane protein